MFFLRKYVSFLAFPLAVLIIATSMPIGVVQAALVSTEQVIEKSEIEADRARVAAFLTREDVRREMRALGVDPDEATARVATMTDAEVRQIAARFDAIPAGQGGVAEALIAAALIIFIVLLITDLMGVTDVFPFVKGGKASRSAN